MAQAPPIVHEVLSSPGQSLDAATRQSMEARFQHDFSGVRIHTDEKAAASSRAVNATAYTVGHHIAFDTGKFAPTSRSGAQLLAHELTHVVQQSHGGSGPPGPAAESAAEHVASTFHSTTGRLPLGGFSGPGIARQKAPDAKLPPLDLAVSQDRGRSLVLLNGVAIAESNAPASAINLSVAQIPERLLIRIDLPEGKTGYVIEGPATHAALSKLSTHYRIEIREKHQPVGRSSGELDGPVDTAPSYVTQQTFEGSRPKPAPAKKPPAAPTTTAAKPPPPPTSPPPTNAPPATQTPIQIGPSPPIPDLNLPPSAKYGKPMTDRERGQETINKIISDAMAGRPGVPPPIPGLDPKSLMEMIKQGVTKAVQPLIKHLPKDVREFVIEKIHSAVEKGAKAAAYSAVDSLQIDETAKAAMKKAIDAAFEVKPAPSAPAQ